jgi:hypothetical protein
MTGMRRSTIAILFCAALAAVSCASKGAPVSLVGTWKSDKLVYMFDADGSCTQIDLGMAGAYQNGKYKVTGDRVDIAFDSGLGLSYTFRRLESGNLQVTDGLTRNSFEFARER